MVIGLGDNGAVGCSVAGWSEIQVKGPTHAPNLPARIVYLRSAELGRYCVMLQQARCRLKADAHSAPQPRSSHYSTKIFKAATTPPRTLVLEQLRSSKPKTTILQSPSHFLPFPRTTLSPTPSPNLPSSHP